MALTATIHTFEISLSHVDRAVYDTVSLRVARHPSESEEFLVARVLAYCLELAEGIGFSRGLAEPDEPALSVRDLTGTILSWIEIGLPDAPRLHRASKAAPRVVVYTHRNPDLLVRQLAGERIHRPEALELYSIDRGLVAALVERLERRMTFDMSVTDGQVYIGLGGETLSGPVLRISLAG